VHFERLIASSTSASDIQDFVAAYRDAFGGAPYFETYSDEYIRDEVLIPHLENGLVVVARDNGHVVGFGCTVPVYSSPPDVMEYIKKLSTEPGLPSDLALERTWYMSELGTVTTYRLRGVAYQVVRSRLISVSHMGGLFYFMRTAKEGSNSRHLYARIGALPIGQPQNVGGLRVTKDSSSRSLERQYMYGRVSDGLEAVLGRIRESADTSC
jgi:hypothetical protein